MGADIWLGKPSESLGYFRDSYSPLNTLNALGMSYWQDLVPLLEESGAFPLERNGWLLGELRQRVALRLQASDAAEQARGYLTSEMINQPQAAPAAMVAVWYAHIQELIRLIEYSTRIGVPLYMSL